MREATTSLLAELESQTNERALLKEVRLEVHARDVMYEPGRGAHYLGVGLSALHCIERLTGDREEPKSVLDFASGYGRVLRFLRVRYPSAEIVASEVEVPALSFCARTFGAEAIPSNPRLDELEWGRTFDLIWCGSLFTHLAETDAQALLAFFSRHLAPGGVCAMSAHGDVTVEALRSGSSLYGLPRKAADEVLSAFDQDGYGYADYDGMDGYGISVATRARIEAMAGATELSVTEVIERGWDDHHDVYGLVGAQESAPPGRGP